MDALRVDYFGLGRRRVHWSSETDTGSGVSGLLVERAKGNRVKRERGRERERERAKVLCVCESLSWPPLTEEHYHAIAFLPSPPWRRTSVPFPLNQKKMNLLVLVHKEIRRLWQGKAKTKASMV